MSETRRVYRNLSLAGEHIEGEYSFNGVNWIKFSGILPLMRIGAVCDLPGGLRKIMSMADGYGYPGYFPSGYDWSGIRDSTPSTMEKMDAVAKQMWGTAPWPWERNDAETRYCGRP
jgi:hypothetical protein